MGQGDELVGGLAHGANDHDHAVTVELGPDGPPRSPMDALSVRDAGAAEFLNDQSHQVDCTTF